MSSDLEAKLGQLKRLKELDLLTDEEFGEQKRAILGAFMGTTPASPSLSGSTQVQGATPAGGEAFGGGRSVVGLNTPASGPSLGGSTTVNPSGGLPERLGNYRVLGLIGSGGMGKVVRARHDSEGWARRQGGDVAIKLIHPHIAADPSFQELAKRVAGQVWGAMNANATCQDITLPK